MIFAFIFSYRESREWSQDRLATRDKRQVQNSRLNIVSIFHDLGVTLSKHSHPNSTGERRQKHVYHEQKRIVVFGHTRERVL